MCCYSLKIFLEYFLISEIWIPAMVTIEGFNADIKEKRKTSYLWEYRRKKGSSKKAKYIYIYIHIHVCNPAQ